MKVWYFHYAHPDWHERNDYLWREVAKSWKGHDFEVANLFDPKTTKRLERSGKYVDVAYIVNFQAAEALAESRRLDVVKKAKFRLYITGGGWRRPEWVQRSLRGVKTIKADLICLTHLPHEDKFRAIHPHVHHVGLGFDPKVFYPAPNEDKFLWMVFCGNLGMGREKNLRRILEACQGKVNFKRSFTHSQMSAYLRHARVGWNQIARGRDESCNLRVWEVLGCGTLLFCSWSRHVPLKDGVHYISWKKHDMVAKAIYWLNDKHREEREKIARQGHEEAIRKHTWAHRAQEYKALIEKYL